jgi:hypothetical protein
MLALAACERDAPALSIRYALSDGPAQACPSQSCSEIAMTCDAVLQVRIVDPDDPRVAYVSECIAVDNPANLCAIARADLPPHLQIPADRVEVQVAVYPRSMVEEDGVLKCPSNLQFSGENLPVSVFPTPAFAGRAFVDGDDAQVVVELGCTDSSLVNDPSCQQENPILVTASADDFDTRLFIPPALATQLSIRVGEPVARANPEAPDELEWALDPGTTAPLPQSVFSPVPGWQGSVNLQFLDRACLQVLEEVPEATGSIMCRRVLATDTSIDLRGVRVARSTLTQILGALGLGQFPQRGLVLGMIVDHLGNPVAGATVIPSQGTISYLTGDRSATIPGGSMTSSSGVFVSQDAPFDASWQVVADTFPVAQPVGGLVVGKLTVLVIALGEPPSG